MYLISKQSFIEFSRSTFDCLVVLQLQSTFFISLCSEIGTEGRKMMKIRRQFAERIETVSGFH